MPSRRKGERGRSSPQSIEDDNGVTDSDLREQGDTAILNLYRGSARCLTLQTRQRGHTREELRGGEIQSEHLFLREASSFPLDASTRTSLCC